MAHKVTAGICYASFFHNLIIIKGSKRLYFIPTYVQKSKKSGQKYLCVEFNKTDLAPNFLAFNFWNCPAVTHDGL